MIEQHDSLSEKFIKKGFRLYAFTFFIAPLGYITKIIISHEISVEEVGILYWIISMITLLAGFNDFGMTDSMNKFIPQYITQKDYGKIKGFMIIAFITQIITSFLIFCVFFFGSRYIAIHFLHAQEAISVIKIFSFFFIGLNLFQIISTFFIALENTFLNKSAELVRMLCVLLFILYIYLGDTSSLVNFSYGWLFGLLMGILFSYSVFYLKYYRHYLYGVKIDISKKELQKIFGFSVTIFLALQAATILGQIDMLMVGYFLGPKEAGYYTNYLSLIGIPFMVLTPIFGLLFPIISGLNAKNELNKVVIIKNSFVRLFTIISICTSSFFFVFGREISLFFFGEKFINSGIILQYSILFLVFNFLLQINFNIMSAVGYVKQRMFIVCIAIFCNIISNSLCIYLLGTPGAALASGIGWLIIWILTERTLFKEYPLNIDTYILLKNILTFSILGGASYFSRNLFLPFGNHFEIFIFLACMLGIYVSTFILVNKQDFSTAIKEIKKIRAKS